MADKNSEKREPWNKGKKGVKRATKAVMEYRIQKVARMMGQGATQADIVQYAKAEWGLSYSQGRRLWREAMTEVKENWSIDRDEFAALILQQVNALLKKTNERQNDAVTLGCLNTAAKIAKLFD